MTADPARVTRVLALTALLVAAGVSSLAATTATATAAAAATATATAAAVSPAARAGVRLPAWGTSASAASGVRATLFGVAARSGQAWAVGGANPTGAPPTQVLTGPYAERFDGTRWIATPVPPVTTFGSSRSVALRGAAAAGVADVWAVGSVEDISSLASRTLAYHWDGTAWSRAATPNPSSAYGNHLAAVAVQSAHAVYAVGDTGYPARSLVLRYDGTGWGRLAVPDYGPLRAVTADASGVWVAGARAVARFDGSSWTRLPALPAGAGTVQLTGLAGGAAALWAVGDDQVPYFEGYLDTPYAVRFSGARWIRLPGSGANHSYTGVASDGRTAWTTSSQDTVTRFTAAGARTEITPAPGRVLNAVAVDPGGRQWVVGGGTGATGDQPAIITSPGIGQGGLVVAAGAGRATVTWLGAVTGSGVADAAGTFAVGGLPTGTYTVVASLAGCRPGIGTATVSQGLATRVDAPVTCS